MCYTLNMKKVEKKEKEYTSEDVMRYLGAMQEHTNDRFDAIQEYLPSMNKKLDDHSKILEAHTEMIGNLAVRLQVVQESVELIRGDLRRKIERDEFETLMRRVLMIEKRVLR